MALLVALGAPITILVLYLLMRTATAWSRRRVTERIVIGQLATVVRQNLPLSTALALAARSEFGAARVHLSRIANLLAEGLALSESVRIGFPDCSSLILSLIVAGERSGQLPTALEQAEAHLIEQGRRRQRFDASVWPYLLAMMTATVLLVAGIMIAVVPKYKEIFKDFGTQLPAITMSLIDLSEWFVGFGAISIGLIFVIPVGMYLSFRPRRLGDLAWTSRAADWIRWRIPGRKRMEFGDGMACMLRAMWLAVRAGMGLEPAARLAAGIDVNCCLRQRMVRFAELLRGGTKARAAAKLAGLGEVTAIALASGVRSGDMQAALRYASEYHDAIVSRWWIFLSRLAWPAGTLVMATLVGYVVVALFLPLVALINSTAG